MLGDLYQGDVDQALTSGAAVPMAPPKVEPRSAWSAIPRGIGSGAAKVGAAVLDSAAAVPEDDYERRRRDAAGIPAPDMAGAAKGVRDFERGLRPDPATAGIAEKVLFGVSSVLTEIAPAAVVAGPAAGALVGGVSEGASTADDLAREGVDKDTRTKAGVIIGAVTGIGAVLPFAGPTVKATAGLYVAGGPGAFMAQQAATRKILEDANYPELAKQYDPLDPVGLAMSSLIPLPFAAAGVRANLKARSPRIPEGRPAPAVSPETVDAAMVHNLTLQRDIADARAADILPREGQSVPIQSLAEFAAARGVKEPAAVKAGPDPFLTWLRDQGGISAAEKFDITGERAGISRGAIFRRDGVPLDILAERAERDGFLPPGTVADAGDNGGTRALADLVQRAAGGERITTQADMVAQRWAERQAADRAETVSALEDRLRLLGEDPTAARGDLDTLEAYLAQHEDRLLAARVAEIVDQQRAFEQTTPEPARRAEPPPQVERARLAMQDMEDSGKTAEEFIRDANLTPDVQNLVVGLIEAGKNAKRADEMLADFARTVAARPGAKATDVAADVVEASRRGETVTSPPPDSVTPDTAAAVSVRDRIQKLEAAAPDMVVRVEEDGKPVTLADELARIRREAEQGVGDELGAADADLVRVAADCAISLGAA